MFFRKLMVMVLPILLLAAFWFLMPFLNTLSLGFFDGVVRGVCLGIGLALIMPIAGAGKRREHFAALLWIPAVLTLLVLVYQYLEAMGIFSVEYLHVLATEDREMLTIESLFLAYMAVVSLRLR